ncbi:MAG: hypothetical protein HXY51_06360 [Nitrospirae bacterium]|nr:hypothetical protein [Nitrospirota bacterium]
MRREAYFANDEMLDPNDDSERRVTLHVSRFGLSASRVAFHVGKGRT